MCHVQLSRDGHLTAKQSLSDAAAIQTCISAKARVLFNSIKKLGFDFRWVSQPSDLETASVRMQL